MAEKFGLNGEVRELKIGRSFEKNGAQSAFHTIRYDFKPASVDSSREGLLQLDENKSVSITVPHLHGAGQTNFSGRVKNSNAKECILIIDRETGEITIERLSSQILVKKTRQEKNPAPLELPSVPPPPPQPQPSVSSAKPVVANRPMTPVERLKQQNIKQPQAFAFASEPARPSSPPNSLLLPSQSLNTQDEKRKISQAAAPPPPVPASAPAPLSSSSSSSDSSSDDSSSSDSGSDAEDQPPRPGSNSSLSMPSFVSGGLPPPSMPSLTLPSARPNVPTGSRPAGVSALPRPPPATAAPARPPPSSGPRAPVPRPAANAARPMAAAAGRAPAAQSMPQFLNDDLQLSESEDDSDS